MLKFVLLKSWRLKMRKFTMRIATFTSSWKRRIRFLRLSTRTRWIKCSFRSRSCALTWTSWVLRCFNRLERSLRAIWTIRRSRKSSTSIRWLNLKVQSKIKFLDERFLYNFTYFYVYQKITRIFWAWIFWPKRPSSSWKCVKC